MILFADDLGLCVMEEHSATNLITTLSAKSMTVNDWCNANKLSLNAEKVRTSHLVFKVRGLPIL